MDGEGRLATDMQWVVVMRDTVRSKMVDCFAPAQEESPISGEVTKEDWRVCLHLWHEDQAEGSWSGIQCKCQVSSWAGCLGSD